jgi:hypothetical protein
MLVLDRRTTPTEVANWIIVSRIRVLNIAGNRESKNPGIGQQAEALMLQVFALLPT